MVATKSTSRAGLQAASRPIRFALPCLALLLLGHFGVLALQAETVQGCSTVNARVLGGYVDNHGNLTDEVLMRDDGQILSTRRTCGGGDNPGVDFADDFSDGLFRFVDCGPNGPVSTSYLTRDGEVVLTVPSANTGQFSEGLAPLEGGRWSYMDRRGETVIPPQFDEVGRFSEGVAAVHLKDQWEYIDRSGAVVIRPPLVAKQHIENAFPFESGLALVSLYDPENRKNSNELIDHAGKVVMRGAGEFGEGLALKISHGKYGFVDTAGKMVVAPQFTYVPELPFQEGLAAVFVGEGATRRAGFINRQGQWAIPPKFEDALHFCDGLAPAKIGGRWGYINPSGESVIAPRFEGAESFDDGMGAVLERDEGGKLRQEFINRKGEILYRETGEMQVINIDDSSIFRKRCFIFFHCHI
ncbi:MAG: WG repeat-containing protein [Candidatus Acidiferrales bacterium]